MVRCHFRKKSLAKDTPNLKPIFVISESQRHFVNFRHPPLPRSIVCITKSISHSVSESNTPQSNRCCKCRLASTLGIMCSLMICWSVWENLESRHQHLLFSAKSQYSKVKWFKAKLMPVWPANLLTTFKNFWSTLRSLNFAQNYQPKCKHCLVNWNFITFPRLKKHVFVYSIKHS